MMKLRNILFVATAAVASFGCDKAFGWSPKWDLIHTEFAEKVTPKNAWQSYPRPQLKRAEWLNLNGLWNYSVTAQDVDRKQVKYKGEILVPYAIESALSGVNKDFMPTDKLWYKREFEIAKSWSGKDVIIHFGAVDYECTLWINGKEVGSHIGGNNPFSFNITPYLSGSSKQVVELGVVDPTDTNTGSRGKQKIDPMGIWYSPVSGIWKSVWLEPVSKSHIVRIKPTSDIDNETMTLNLITEGLKGGEKAKITVYDDGKVLRSIEANAALDIVIPMNGATLWSGTTPKLYHFDVDLIQNGEVVDSAKSYFAMRKSSMVKYPGTDYNWFGLNNEPKFHLGPLDQGWWPDGLLTPPSEEALLYDMEQIKKMGFNTIRKHIKVEPEIFYYYADSLGLMVWQDMVSGFQWDQKESQHAQPNWVEDWDAPQAHRDQWESELFTMIDQLEFYPSIVSWVVFNEGWGQYNTVDVVNRVMEYDKTRVINGVTGWADRKVGDVSDIHNYQAPSMLFPEENSDRISVLGEFGGNGTRWKIDGHIWDKKTIVSKRASKCEDDLKRRYSFLFDNVEALATQGMAGAIYTQIADVEVEVNGLMTYDRRIVKIQEEWLHEVNSRLYDIVPRQSTTLVSDKIGQRKVYIDNKESVNHHIKANITGDHVITSKTVFTADKAYEGLSIWLKSSGMTEVKLNGKVVFNDLNTNTRAHYQHYNVSKFADLLKVGENTLEVKIDKTDKTRTFDYRLVAY